MSYLDKIKEKFDYKAKLAKFILTEEEQSKRIDICNSCEFLFTPTRNCKKCGCFVDAKATLANAYCPINKWPKIIINKE